MHVAVVSSSLDPWTTPGRPDWCGRARHLREVVDTLAAGGHRVEVVVPGSPGHVVDGSGPVVHRVPLDPAAPDPAAAVRTLTDHLSGLWRDRRPDIVHAHHWIAALAARQASAGAPLPVVQTVHGGALESDRDRSAVEHAVLRGADHVVVTSSADHRTVKGIGVRADRLRIVPLTVDDDEFHPSGPALRRGTRLRLVALGGADAEGGVDRVVRALATVPDAELLVAGGLPAGADDPERARLFTLARTHGVGRRVRFLGPVERADVPRLIRSADVVVSAAPHWSTGIAALEAMACGRAVVTAAVGGNADVVVDQVCGLTVPPRDDRALSRGLREVLSRESSRLAFGAAGRNRVEVAFRRTHLARALGEVFERARVAGSS